MEETVQMQEGLDSPDVEISEPLEGAFGKYLREFRLLNSLLLSLFFVVFLFVCLWGIIIWEAPPGDQGSDFADPGKQASAPEATGAEGPSHAKAKVGQAYADFYLPSPSDFRHFRAARRY